MPEIRSRKVRKILTLEVKAQRLLDRYQRHRDQIEPLRTRALRLLQEARATETTLTGSQPGAPPARPARPGPRHGLRGHLDH